MAIIQYKPTTPGQRGMTSRDFSEITVKKPLKSLLVVKRRGSGRNNQGRITTRHKGGGVRKFYRMVNFKLASGLSATVEAIEYDPNRSARIALIKYADGTLTYIIAPDNLKVGAVITSGEDADIVVGNTLPLANIPLGTFIHNVELKPGKGAQLARSAGSSCILVAKDEKYSQIKLPSGEVRMVLNTCKATIGVVSNLEHENISLGKAGRSRWLGRRPKVRGVAMNPVDHPMGGGEGKTSGGGHPVSPWGLPTKGYKTRKKKNLSNKFIVKRRK